MKAYLVSSIALFICSLSLTSCNKEAVGEFNGTKGCIELPDSSRVNEQLAIYSCVDYGTEFLLRLRRLDQNGYLYTITLKNARDTFFYEPSTPLLVGLEVIIKPLAKIPQPGMVIIEARDTVIIYE